MLERNAFLVSILRILSFEFPDLSAVDLMRIADKIYADVNIGFQAPVDFPDSSDFPEEDCDCLLCMPPVWNPLRRPTFEVPLESWETARIEAWCFGNLSEGDRLILAVKNLRAQFPGLSLKDAKNIAERFVGTYRD